MNSSVDSLLSGKWGIGLLVLVEILLVLGVFAMSAKTELARDSDP